MYKHLKGLVFQTKYFKTTSSPSHLILVDSSVTHKGRHESRRGFYQRCSLTCHLIISFTSVSRSIAEHIPMIQIRSLLTVDSRVSHRRRAGASPVKTLIHTVHLHVAYPHIHGELPRRWKCPAFIFPLMARS